MTYVTVHKLAPGLTDDASALESYRAHMSEISGHPVVVSRNFLFDAAIMRVQWETKEAAVAELGYDPGE